MVVLESKNICGDDRYKLIFENSTEAIMTLEPPNWRFSNGNPATLKMFGVKSTADFNSLTPGDLSPEKQPDGELSSTKAKAQIEKALKEDKNTFNWTHKRYAGEAFPAEVTLIKMIFDGKEIIQAIVRDLTKQHQAEKALQEKIREAEKLNKLMVGRELKMIELKKEIEALKNSKNPTKTPSENRFQDGIKLEEDVIQALEHDYETMVRDSELNDLEKNQIIEKLQTLLSDSRKHEQALKDLA